MIPGEVFAADGTLTLNEGASATTLMVANTGDRPVQVGSHYHFAETNPALEFDRDAARGMRLDIASGTAVRFEPGQRREVQLIAIGGARRVFGFNGQVMGTLCLILALLLGAAFPQGAGAQSPECNQEGTQQTLNACAAEQYRSADSALNDAWGPAKAFADSIGQGRNLLEVQRAWLAYRDFACDVHSSPYRGGSIHPLIELNCLTAVTQARTLLLRDFRSF